MKTDLTTQHINRILRIAMSEHEITALISQLSKPRTNFNREKVLNALQTKLKHSSIYLTDLHTQKGLKYLRTQLKENPEVFSDSERQIIENFSYFTFTPIQIMPNLYARIYHVFSKSGESFAYINASYDWLSRENERGTGQIIMIDKDEVRKAIRNNMSLK